MHPSDEEDFVDEYYNDLSQQDSQSNLFYSRENIDCNNKNRGKKNYIL